TACRVAGADQAGKEHKQIGDLAEPIVHIIDGPAQLEQSLHAPFPLPRSREGTVSLPRLSPLSFGPAVMAPRPRNLPRPPRGRQLEKRTREDGRRKSILPR